MKAPQKVAPILASLEEARMPIGDKIASLRTAKGWSQRELAKKLGTKAPNVSNWENDKGSPSAETLKELAQVFDVSVDYLLFDQVPMRPLGGFQDVELAARLQEMDHLDPHARTALKRILDALIAEKRVKEAVGQGR